MPNKNNIRKWIKALRSGQYEQTTGRLHRRREGKDKYCCLGVACDLAVQNGVPVDVQGENSIINKSYDGRIYDLPDSVKKWLGITETFVVEEVFGRPVKLSSLNDSYGYTFRQIADALEKNFIEGDTNG